MKIAILAAGTSKYFPLFFDKPKCLYHLDGMVQLQYVIEDARQFVKDEDIIVVAGYKYKYIQDFLKQYPAIKLKINYDYKKSAIYSFRKAVEGENDDMIIMLADERISRQNIKRLVDSKRKMAILCHDNYYYYSVGILKLRKDNLDIINDDRYLSMDAMKEIYCFANKKTKYDGVFSINSGVCLGYIFIDLVRKVGGIKEIENPVTSYVGTDIDFLHYDPEKEYIPDLDYFSDTDEYKNNILLSIFINIFSSSIRYLGEIIKQLEGNLWNH